MSIWNWTVANAVLLGDVYIYIYSTFKILTMTLLSGQAYARYTSPQCASYARDKLNGFEYPIGSPLVVRFSEEQARAPPPVPQNNMRQQMGIVSGRGFDG